MTCGRGRENSPPSHCHSTLSGQWRRQLDQPSHLSEKFCPADRLSPKKSDACATPADRFNMQYVCMARVNIYLPDDLALAAHEAGRRNVSAVTRQAVADALSVRATDAWVETLELDSSDVTREKTLAAVAAYRDELDG
jgi:post-segregation antitoxin (ccd killing protein)